jgi:hypothetical protein
MPPSSAPDDLHEVAFDPSDATLTDYPHELAPEAAR